MPNKRIDFSDINLIPRKCIVESRSECSTLTMLGTHTFELPVVPANMECVINDEIAERLGASGFFYIHHRFNTDAVAFTRRQKCSVSAEAESCSTRSQILLSLSSVRAPTSPQCRMRRDPLKMSNAPWLMAF